MARIGTQIAGFEIVEPLGEGGNATVYRVRRLAGGEDVALKILKTRNPQSDAYRRFRREMDIMQRLAGHPGVLPVLETSLPDRPSSSSPAWLAMPIAKPLAEALKSASVEEVVSAISSIAETLAELLTVHGLSHRDLKPHNLYVFNEHPVVGDFGLVDLPDLEALTAPGAKLGPVNFMPYEMLRDASTARGEPADVYSLAKTLWVLVAGQRWAPPGEQRASNPDHGMGQYRPHPRIRALDELVERATRAAPDTRPTLLAFAGDLQAWLAPPAETTASFDISEIGHRLRAAAAPELDKSKRAHELRVAGGKLARRLTEPLKPVERSLRAEYPLTQVSQNEDSFILDISDRLQAEALTDLRRMIRLDSAAERPISLIVEWRLLVTPDSLVQLNGLAFLGITWALNAAQTLWQVRMEPLPVDSLQAEQAADRIVEDIRSGLPSWVEAFARRIEESSGG